MGATSEHFSDNELSCHHCGVNECKPALVAALEDFRRLLGKPIIVIDAYRCLDHNKAAGGVGASQHCLGVAADIRVKGMSAADLYRASRNVPAFRGLGRNDAGYSLHVDLRGEFAQWCYGPDGKWCHWFPLPDEGEGKGNVNA